MLPSLEGDDIWETSPLDTALDSGNPGSIVVTDTLAANLQMTKVSITLCFTLHSCVYIMYLNVPPKHLSWPSAKETEDTKEGKTGECSRLYVLSSFAKDQQVS